MIRVRIRKLFPPGLESAGFSLDVEFEAGPGVTVLFGQSGCGKTLTLDCIAGLTAPDIGRILLNDRILFDSGARVNLPARDRRCGYVFQNYSLFPNMTLRENLAFAAYSLPRLERHRKIAESFETFRLAEFAGRYPRELSGGQKQRGSIARALLTQPEILLLDEPARGLDQELRSELYATIQDLRGLSIPVLLVTHGVEELFTLGDHVLVYEAGHILRTGAPRELLQNPGTEAVARLLGDFRIFQAEVIALDPARQTSRVRAVLRQGEPDELAGPHLPGCFRGDRIQLCLRPEELQLHSKPGQNRILVELQSIIERPQSVRADFGGSLVVDLPRQDWRALADADGLWVEVPASAMRHISGSQSASARP